jgi:ATP-dependent Zn protease
MKSGQYDKMNISLSSPKPRVQTTHTNVQKTRRERVTHQQNRSLRRQERSERTQGVQNAFVTLLLIILFVIFSWMTFFNRRSNTNSNIDDLEVFDGVPLFVFVLMLLLFLGSLLSYVISYYKLKEREV